MLTRDDSARNLPPAMPSAPRMPAYGYGKRQTRVYWESQQRIKPAKPHYANKGNGASRTNDANGIRKGPSVETPTRSQYAGLDLEHERTHERKQTAYIHASEIGDAAYSLALDDMARALARNAKQTHLAEKKRRQLERKAIRERENARVWDYAHDPNPTLQVRDGKPHAPKPTQRVEPYAVWVAHNPEAAANAIANS